MVFGFEEAESPSALSFAAYHLSTSTQNLFNRPIDDASRSSTVEAELVGKLSQSWIPLSRISP